MSGPPVDRRSPTAEALNRELIKINEALLTSSVRQHELTELAEKAQAAMQESHARFELLFDTSPIGMVLVDRGLTIRLVSRAALPLFGDVPNIIDRKFDEAINFFWSQESAHQMVANLQNTLDTGESFATRRFPGERLDRSEPKWYDWKMDRIGLPDGQFGVVCYFVDISPQVAAEASLRASEEGFRRLFEASQDAILILDFDSGKIADANPFIQDLIQVGHAELVGKELWEIGLFSDKAAARTALIELKKNGYVKFENLPVRTRTGSLVVVEFVGKTYEVTGRKTIQCNMWDVTERRRVEHELINAVQYGVDIVATLREPFLVLDGELRVKSANRAFYEAFQVSSAETENRLVYELGNGQWDIPSLRILLDRVLSRKESVEDFEVEHTFPTLGLKTMVLNARPFPPESEHPELILLAVEDVSAVRERADELAEENRRKDVFLAMLSHELRNPLAPILTAVQMLQLQTDASPLQKQTYSIIDRQLAHLSHLVNDLLDVSRVTSGRIHLKRQQCDMRGIVETAVGMVRFLIDRRGHLLEIDLPPTPVWVDVDSTRLEQAVANVLVNAAKYMDPGGRIWATLRTDGTEAVLTVRDTGVGIAPEFMPRVFDIFAQADRSLDRADGGMGVGLSLAHQLMELHGGSIEAVSPPVGETVGTEFVLRLPLVTAAELNHLEPVSEARFEKSQLRVLLVDDNVDLVTVLSMYLESQGHDVQFAHDGLDGLSLARQWSPDIVLLDIGLPGMGGHDVARNLRSDPGNKMHLIAVTGYGRETDVALARGAGFDSHLTKPFNFSELQTMISAVAEPARCLRGSV